MGNGADRNFSYKRMLPLPSTALPAMI